jgi:hypothetical protein
MTEDWRVLEQVIQTVTKFVHIGLKMPATKSMKRVIDPFAQFANSNKQFAKAVWTKTTRYDLDIIGMLFHVKMGEF